MAQRTVVRGGKVVDGTGMPGFTADVEVTDGRITAVGRLSTAGAEVIDADGLVVSRASWTSTPTTTPSSTSSRRPHRPAGTVSPP